MCYDWGYVFISCSLKGFGKGEGTAWLTGMCVGCDKTVPAQIMGGISANKPVLPLLTGPMMPGSHRGKRVGACTDCRNNWASFRAGTIDLEEIMAVDEELAPTVGLILCVG